MRTKEGNKDQAIIKAAIKCFAQNGYHRTQISKIAEVAGIATGSIYLYYSNKEMILNKIFKDTWEILANNAEDIYLNKAFSPAEKLDTFIDMFFDLFTQNPSLAMVFVNEQRSLPKKVSYESFQVEYDKFFKQGELILKEGVSKKEFNQDINIKMVRNFIFGGIRFLLHMWADNHHSYPLNQVRENVKLIMKKGVLI